MAVESDYSASCPKEGVYGCICVWVCTCASIMKKSVCCMNLGRGHESVGMSTLTYTVSTYCRLHLFISILYNVCMDIERIIWSLQSS